jgi:hypothetical protein
MSFFNNNYTDDDIQLNMNSQHLKPPPNQPTIPSANGAVTPPHITRLVVPTPNIIKENAQLSIQEVSLALRDSQSRSNTLGFAIQLFGICNPEVLSQDLQSVYPK